MVIQTLHRNTSLAQEAIRIIAREFTGARNCDCKNALSTALITRKDAIPAETLKKLDLLVHKYLKE
jgi:5'-methylthioadenosine phosphorylase